MQTYLTTIHGNSWDCAILPSLSQLLPDTLSDLISDTRSALLRDSLWWEADKEEDCNSDQAEHCSFDLCSIVPTQSATRILSSYCNQSSRLTVRRTVVTFISALIYAISWPWDIYIHTYIWTLIGVGHTPTLSHTHAVTHPCFIVRNSCKSVIALVTFGLKVQLLLWFICANMIR